MLTTGHGLPDAELGRRLRTVGSPAENRFVRDLPDGTMKYA